MTLAYLREIPLGESLGESFTHREKESNRHFWVISLFRTFLLAGFLNFLFCLFKKLNFRLNSVLHDGGTLLLLT